MDRRVSRRARRCSSACSPASLVTRGARRPRADPEPGARGRSSPPASDPAQFIRAGGPAAATGARSPSSSASPTTTRCVGIVDSHEHVVRTLDADVALARAPSRSRYIWDGRDDAGALAPPGRYRLLVDLPSDGPRDDLAAPDHRGIPLGPPRPLGASVNASALELIGILVGCGAAAAALVLEDRRAQPAAMAVALVARPGARPRQRLGRAPGRRLPHQPGPDRRRGRGRGGGRSAASLRCSAAGRRRSRSRRSPSCRCGFRSRSAGETANLLVPLYLVIAAGSDRPRAGQRPTSRGRRRETSRRIPWPRAPALGSRRRPSSSTRSRPPTPRTSRTRSRTSASSSPRSRSSSRSSPRSSGRGRLLGRVLIAVGAVAAVCAADRRSTSTSPATCSSTRSCSTRTSSTSTSGSTRCSSTRTSSAAIWRSRSTALGACIAWGGERAATSRGRGARRSGLARGPGVQLLDHQLRRPARRARDRRAAALGLARRGAGGGFGARRPGRRC